MARTRFGVQRSGNRIREVLDGRPEPVSPRTLHRRQRALTIGFTALAALYGVRLGDLQLVEGAAFRARAVSQSLDQEELPASRGRILDRDGSTLVSDDTRYHAYLAPRELTTSRDQALTAIGAVLDLSPDRRSALAAARDGWETIARGVTDEERQALQSGVGPGVHFDALPARAYPRGGIARGLIGRVGAEGHGASGLELYLDSLLRGQPGRARVRVDGRREAYRPPDAVLAEPRPGYDVVLTIDAELQRIAENELSRALASTGSSAGDILLLDPRNGEILAVASERGDAAPGTVPAFSDPYEPGSTAKPFLLAALLNENRVDLDEVIDVEGGELKLGRRVIRDVHGFEQLTVRDVIAKSSNVGAAKLVSRLRPQVQYSYLRDFGFGMPTQVDHPAESAGRLRRVSEWTSLSPASHAIGYEMSVTSLQLVTAYAAIANHGLLMRPTLVKEVRGRDGRVVWRAEPHAVRQVVRPEVARAVGRVLEEVVQDGTGSLANFTSIAVAGKTGTARLATDGGYARGRYRASFVGYAPADAPRVVILTRLEDPENGAYYGGAIAAPTSHATLEAALVTRGGRLDESLVRSQVEPRRWTEPGAVEEDAGPFVFAVGGGEQTWSADAEREGRAVTVPSLTGLPLRSAVARLHELGLKVEWYGKGTVRRQSPAPGRAVARGRAVVLR